MTIEGLSAGELEQKIAERVAVLKEAVDRAICVARILGREASRTVNSCNIHVVYEVNEGNFDISADLGQSMFGGDNVKVVYLQEVVLDIYYQATVDEAKVSIFSPGQWLDELRSLAEHAEELKSSRAADQQKAIATGHRLDGLVKTAKRLGL